MPMHHHSYIQKEIVLAYSSALSSCFKQVLLSCYIMLGWYLLGLAEKEKNLSFFFIVI